MNIQFKPRKTTKEDFDSKYKNIFKRKEVKVSQNDSWSSLGIDEKKNANVTAEIDNKFSLK